MEDNVFPSEEAALLMYISGEMSAAHSAQNEQRLTQDAQLRQMLDDLRSLQDSAGAMLAETDRFDRLLPEATALRRANRAIRQWALTPPPQKVPVAVEVTPIPWVKYGLSAAAALLLSLGIWASFHDHRPQNVAVNSPPLNWQNGKLTDRQAFGVMQAVDPLFDTDESDDIQFTAAITSVQDTNMAMEPLFDGPLPNSIGLP